MARAELATETLRAILREGRTAELPAVGISMRPLLAPGRPLRVVHATVDELRPGDVVVVDTGDALVCHRLVYVTRDRLVTRGDDAPACDAPLPHAALIGRIDVPPSPHALYCAVRALLR